MKRTIAVSTPSGSYAVEVGSDLLATLPEALRRAGLSGEAALVADRRVLSLHGHRLAGTRFSTVVEVPEGEASKSIREAERLWTALLQAGLQRGDAIVALGGGVVGDLAGFVAATIHRGVPFVQLPTTLLAQVDSSVGGKVAIDHPLGKNLIGAFHQPRLVVADVATLRTLPLRERWSGLVEVVKAALLADEPFFAWLEDRLEAIAEGDEAAQIEAIARSVEIKARIVEADERETGPRRHLNLGHTIGHALEVASGYGHLTHGEAVLVGLHAAVRISERHADLPAAQAARIRRLLGRFPKPELPPLHASALLAATLRDKKRVGRAVRFVVLSRIGVAGTVAADEAMLQEAIEAALEGR